MLIRSIIAKGVPLMDTFRTMTELENATTKNKDWDIITRDVKSAVLIAAIHDGGIEPGTTEVCDLIAEKGHYSFYTFKGLRRQKNVELHVTSRHYDQSTMQVMVSKVYQAVAIHGCIGDESIVYIGGKDKPLMASIEQLLTKANFKVAKAPDHLSGKHDDNIINYTQQNAGVQLELTTALRQSFFKDYKFNRKHRESRDNWYHHMYAFADAIIKAIETSNK